MHVVEITEPGGPEVLKVTTRPRPQPAADEILIQIAAAGVNRPDCAQRQGSYPPPAGATDIPGLEVAGTVVEVGHAVEDWSVGDRVCALVVGGGYAEFVNVPAGQCLPVPQDMSLIEAAALPETFFTVWTNLFESGGLQKGETVLIHGGAGGIGTTAIQMASLMGCRVLTTVGKKESVEICRELGAERVILYKEEDFEEVVRSFADKKGVNVVLDMIGGDYFQKNLNCLAEQGRLVQIATMHGSNVSLDLRQVMFKRLTLTGSTLRSRSVSEKSRIARSLIENIWPFLNQGKMKPIIYKEFPLEDAAKAHALMESSQHTGKIVLVNK